MTKHITTDVGAILNLVDISIIRAEAGVEAAADMASTNKAISTSQQVTERMGHVDALHELRQAILEATATGRRVPNWLLWLCPKVKAPKKTLESPVDWNSLKVDGEVWEGMFKK